MTHYRIDPHVQQQGVGTTNNAVSNTTTPKSLLSTAPAPTRRISSSPSSNILCVTTVPKSGRGHDVEQHITKTVTHRDTHHDDLNFQNNSSAYSSLSNSTCEMYEVGNNNNHHRSTRLVIRNNSHNSSSVEEEEEEGVSEEDSNFMSRDNMSTPDDRSLKSPNVISPLRRNIISTNNVAAAHHRLFKSPSAVGQEIRDLTEGFESLLKKATSEIKFLNVEKSKLEEQCESFMNVNEELGRDLKKSVDSQNDVKLQYDKVVEANSELFNEVQRLTDLESVWKEDNNGLKKKIEHLQDKLDNIDTEQSIEIANLKEKLSNVSDVEREVRMKNLEEKRKLENKLRSLQEECQKFTEENDKLKLNNSDLKRQLCEKDIMITDQMISGGDESNKKSSKMTEDIASCEAKDVRISQLEKENSRLKRDEALVKEERKIEAKRIDSLIQKNKNLTEWRSQIIEKKSGLVEENNRLKVKCQGLEDLLNEEDLNIRKALEMIKRMQCASSSTLASTCRNHSISHPSSSHIQQQHSTPVSSRPKSVSRLNASAPVFYGSTPHLFTTTPATHPSQHNVAVGTRQQVVNNGMSVLQAPSPPNHLHHGEFF